MQIEKILKEMTLEEKASLCSGADFWHTKAVKRLGIPSIMMSDGPNGVRLQNKKADHLGINESVKAVCFPTSSAVGASFDPDLAYEIGKTIGKECQALGLSMILGPGINIKRSPLCGRNFEYYSEDPYLSGEMGRAFIQGVQSQNVGACVKHFAANNQETNRLTSDSVVDERTLHEIYLAGFKKAIQEGRPAGVMCSYNKINGTYAAEHKKLMTDLLRTDWGFDGVVITDWGAVKDRVNGLAAGIDLEMPGGEASKRNDEKIVDAVKNGILSEKLLDHTVRRILKFLDSMEKNEENPTKLDLEQDYETAKKAELECAVLLKNEKELLPLNEGKKVVFIGGFVEKPRNQGSGSSHINSAKLPTVLEQQMGKEKISYAKGFSLEEDVTDPMLEEEAVKLAENSEAAIIFAGLPNRFETEGMDREHLELPENQNALISRVAGVQPNTVVVLHNGSPVTMPWKEEVNSILEMYLGGDGVSEAEMDLLYGKHNPGGKLAETFPVKLEDNPSFLNFPGENGVTEYREGIFVGYRYYEKKKQTVLFPFGHGLSYTSFSYKNLRIEEEGEMDNKKITVSLNVKNTGNYAGKEVVQVYVGQKGGAVRRPEKELKRFSKIFLKPGEEKEVSFLLEKECFSYYETKLHDFYAPTGTYVISIGSSSADIRLKKEILWEASEFLPMEITMETTIGELFAHPKLRPVIEHILKKIYEDAVEDASSEKNQASVESMGEGAETMGESMIMGMSFRSIVAFGAMTEEQVEEMLLLFREQLRKRTGEKNEERGI